APGFGLRGRGRRASIGSQKLARRSVTALSLLRGFADQLVEPAGLISDMEAALRLVVERVDRALAEQRRDHAPAGRRDARAWTCRRTAPPLRAKLRACGRAQDREESKPGAKRLHVHARVRRAARRLHSSAQEASMTNQRDKATSQDHPGSE